MGRHCTANSVLSLLAIVCGCSHFPKIEARGAPAGGAMVFTLEHDAWFARDGTFERGPQFAPTLQTEGGPNPHMSVGFIEAGARLEVVATFSLRYRDGEAELWGIATTADPEQCGLFVAIPLQLGSERHPWFPTEALIAVDAPPRYDGELHACAVQRLRAHDVERWVDDPTP